MNLNCTLFFTIIKWCYIIKTAFIDIIAHISALKLLREKRDIKKLLREKYFFPTLSPLSKQEEKIAEEIKLIQKLAFSFIECNKHIKTQLAV